MLLVVGLERDFVGEFKRPQLDGLHRRKPEEQQDGVFQPLVDHDLRAAVSVRAAHRNLGHPHLPGIQQVDDMMDDSLGIFIGRRKFVAPRPKLFYPRLRLGYVHIKRPPCRFAP